MGTEDGIPPTMFGIPMKWVSLLMLVAQTVSVVFAMRLSRTKATEGPRYLNTTAVFFSEVLKMVCSFAFLVKEQGGVATASRTVVQTFTRSGTELLKVTYQLKILTTAVLSVIILQKALGVQKWTALLLLTVGVALIQFPRGDSAESSPSEGNPMVGLVAVLSACMTSGLAGVYLEKILKQTDSSIWMRNIQLASIGGILAFFGCFMQDGAAIKEHGFLQGYSGLVWMVIFLQAVGGLVVAAVLKYADNLLKCFGNACSIVISCLMSAVFLQEFVPDLMFVMGTILVLMATTLYSVGVPKSVEHIFDRFAPKDDSKKPDDSKLLSSPAARV